MAKELISVNKERHCAT